MPVENGTSCEITAKKLGDINIKVDVESVSERASANKTFTIKQSKRKAYAEKRKLFNFYYFIKVFS